MKYYVIFLFLFIGLYACSKDSNSDNEDNDVEYLYKSWKPVGYFEDYSSYGGVSFKIGEKVYIGLGRKWGKPVGEKYSHKFFCSENGIDWDTIRSFPGKGRVHALSFVLGNKAYVGLGYNDSNSEIESYNDFYCYDQNSGQWTKVEIQYPGPTYTNERHKGIFAFVLNIDGKDIGYVGNYSFDGTNWKKKELYSYDDYYAFVIDNTAYTFSMRYDSTGYACKMNSFNGKSLQPVTLKNGKEYYGRNRELMEAKTFTAKINGEEYGYLITGYYITFGQGKIEKAREFMEFNPRTNTWKIGKMPLRSCVGITSFSINGSVYVMGGCSNLDSHPIEYSYHPIGDLHEIWQFNPQK